jgi:hypothetical protein
MLRFTLIAAALLIGSPAWAQTKDQCGAVANALLPAISSLAPFDKALNAIDWNLIIRNVSGQFRSSAEEAKTAQLNFIEAMRRYRVALEDVARTAQLCAR